MDDIEIKSQNTADLEEAVNISPLALQAAVGLALQEVAKPSVESVIAEQASPAVESAVAEQVGPAVESAVAEQVGPAVDIAVADKVDAIVAESAAQTEVVMAQVEEIKTQVAEIIAQATTIPPENNMTETIAVKHMAQINKVHTYHSTLMTWVFAAGMMIFAGLYLANSSANKQLLADERAKSAQREMTDTATIRELARDLISSQLTKNDDIDALIQNKIDCLELEGMLPAKAIPLAFIDNEVIKEAFSELPPSLIKLPFTKNMLTEQLQQISSVTEKQIIKRN